MKCFYCDNKETLLIEAEGIEMDVCPTCLTDFTREEEVKFELVN